ncbi:MAG: hypothetical protein J5701_05135 [Bacteroidales bacterium]|nr:hypothetical protein [Bacteroidales bacterium]
MRKKDLIILSLIIVMNGLFASGNACFVSSPTSIVVFKTSDMTIKMNKDTLLKHACLKSEKWKMNHLIGAIMLEFQINKKEKGYWSIYIFSSDSMYMYYGEFDKDSLLKNIKADANEYMDELTVSNRTSLSTISEWIWQQTEKGYMVTMEMKNKRKYICKILKNN